MTGYRYYNRKVTFLLISGIVVILISSVFFLRYLFAFNTGLVNIEPEVTVEGNSVIFTPSTPFSVAKKSGLIPFKDKIISLSSQEITNTMDIVLFCKQIDNLKPIAVEILRDDRSLEKINIYPEINLLNPVWIFKLVYIIILSLLAFYLIYRYVFQDWVYILIVLYCFFSILFTTLIPFKYNSFAVNLILHIVKPTAWLLVVFSLYFPEKKLNKPFRTRIIVILLLLFFFYTSIRMVFFSLWYSNGNEEYINFYRFLGRIENIADIGAYILFVVFIVTSYIKLTGRKHRQILEWIMCGFLVSFPAYFFFEQFPYIVGAQNSLNLSTSGFADIFYLFFPLFFILGLKRSNNLNFSSFIIYYITIIVILLFFLSASAFCYLPLVKILQNHYYFDQTTSGFIVTFVLIFLTVTASFFIQYQIKRLFIKYLKLNYQADHIGLKGQVEELKNIIDFKDKNYQEKIQSANYDLFTLVLRGITGFFAPYLKSITGKSQLLLEYLHKIKQARLQHNVKVEILKLISILINNVHQLNKKLKALEKYTKKIFSPKEKVSSTFLVQQSANNFKKLTKCIINCSIKTEERILVSPGEVIAALIMLFQNACEAGIHQEIILTVKKENDSLVIEIEDYGPGINPLLREKYFQPFYSQKEDGTGLGLFISKMLIEKNSGHIEISSDSEQAGGKVKVFLPVINKSK